jgi:hypothetical protein
MNTNNIFDISEKKWLNTRMKYSNIDGSKIESILYLTIICNIFEFKCSNNFAKIDDYSKMYAKKLTQLI